ncbi:MAG TPA: hypothetical protein VEH84_08545 [Alphaproteobacteria bacterium]|nr:hypothetical protein [Alphaproteobacteria bacterium]
METILGTSVPVFLGMTVVLFGGFAVLTGQAMGSAWRGPGRVFAYAVLLALGNRFLDFALFGAPLLHLAGTLVSLAVIFAIAYAAYRATLARRMVSQYPWLYDRAGPFGWREKRA